MLYFSLRELRSSFLDTVSLLSDGLMDDNSNNWMVPNPNK